MRFVCFCALIWSVFHVVSAESRSPNLIFILADDLGYGDLGCYGCEDIRTPHLDSLAAGGIRFTDFYANGAVCTPTRAAFLTGRYQHRIGLEHAVYYQEKGVGLPVDGVTLADRLKSAGYVTGLSGKWHLGYDFERQPNQQGFDHFFGLLSGNHHYFKHMDRVGVHDLWLNSEPVTRQGYSTDLVTEDALSFIEKNRENQFFLYLSHPAPHFPWQGPDDNDKIVEPKKKTWQIGDRETYIAMVESMDRGIGEVIEKLDDLKLRKNTLVVFASDNGGHTWSNNAPLRDYKGTRWEGGVRVPCIANWPGVIEASRVTGQVGITMDWAATFYRLANLPEDPSGEDGMDLLPVLTGADDKTVSRTVFWRRRPSERRKKVRAGRAVRHGDWKLISFEDGDRHLFNLREDISESNDLAKTQPELVEELAAKIEQWEADIEVGGGK